MPCFPGFFPVAKEFQAAADRGRIVDVKLPEEPWFKIVAKFDNSPRAIIGRMISKVAPSSPRTTTLPDNVNLSPSQSNELSKLKDESPFTVADSCSAGIIVDP